MNVIGWFAWFSLTVAALTLDGWWQTAAVVLLVVLGITAERRVAALERLVELLRMRARDY